MKCFVHWSAIEKKGYIFVNEKGEQLSLEWFNERINHYAKIIVDSKKSKNIMQMVET